MTTTTEAVEALNVLTERLQRAQVYMASPDVAAKDKEAHEPGYARLRGQFHVALDDLRRQGAVLAVAEAAGRTVRVPADPERLAYGTQFSDITDRPLSRLKLGLLSAACVAPPHQGSRQHDGTWKYCHCCGRQEWSERRDGRAVCDICHPDPRAPREDET